MKNIRRSGISAILTLLGAFLLTALGVMPASATDGYTLQVIEKASVHSNVHWKGELVEGWHIHFTAAQKRRLMKPSNCIWSDGRNYYSKVDTQHGWHPDYNMHLCRSKKSPTGWVKVGGGVSGIACFNVASPNHVPPLPHVPQIKGPITETWSFSRFFAHLKASEGIKLHVVADCGPAHIDTKIWTKGIVEGSALQKVFLKSNGHISSFNAKLDTALVMSAKNSSKVMVLITCTLTPPPPPTPTYSCDTLHVTQGDNRSVTIDTFSTSESGGATFKNAVINWGDGTSGTFTSPVGQTHTYGADGTYTITGTAHFDVNGTDVSATSNGCQQAVTFNTPAPQASVSATTLNDLYQCEHSANWNVTTSNAGTGYHVRFHTVYGEIKDGIDGNIVTTSPVQGSNTYTFVYYASCDGSATTNLTENVSVDLLDANNNVVDTYDVPPFVIQPTGGPRG